MKFNQNYPRERYKYIVDAPFVTSLDSHYNCETTRNMINQVGSFKHTKKKKKNNVAFGGKKAGR